MKVTDLKKSLFGYEKNGVFRYVTELEAEYVEKLSFAEAEAREKEKSFRERIRELEAQLEALKIDYRELQESHSMISDTLISAERYAKEMREESNRERTEAQAALTRDVAKETAELKKYREAVLDIRHALIEALDKIGADTDLLERKTKMVKAKAPTINITAIRKFKETGK